MPGLAAGLSSRTKTIGTGMPGIVPVIFIRCSSNVPLNRVQRSRSCDRTFISNSTQSPLTRTARRRVAFKVAE